MSLVSAIHWIEVDERFIKSTGWPLARMCHPLPIREMMELSLFSYFNTDSPRHKTKFLNVKLVILLILIKRKTNEQI